MEAAPVYSLADAMFRLPAKLDRLLTSHGHTLPRGAQDEIPLIKQDLEKMIVFLQGHDDSGAEYCGLEEISAKIGGAGANDPDRRAAESALIYAIKMHPARPTFNIQCLDGMFSGEDDYNSEVQEEEYMTLQEQYDISEEDSMDQHVLQKGTWEGAHSRFSAFSAWKTVADKQPDSRNEMPKWSMQVRVGTFQDVNGADDGFNWTKYGQKDILGSKYPREADPSSHRGYYECKHSDTQGCKAEKQLQRTDDDPLLFDVRYINSHTCVQRANSQPQPGHEKSSVSGGVKAKGSMQRLEKMPPR
ncbi:hypothetical protein ACQ4PT_019508 [Festuca glaucescens]